MHERTHERKTRRWYQCTPLKRHNIGIFYLRITYNLKQEERIEFFSVVMILATKMGVIQFDYIVQKPAQNIKLEKQFRSSPSTEKV